MRSTPDVAQRWKVDATMTDCTQFDANVSAFERHYTAKELAELWGLDESTVRRLFRDEPGVLIPASDKRRVDDYK
jgi:hypothetical protein